MFSRQSCLKGTQSAALVKKERTYMDDDDLNAVVAAIEAGTIRNHVHSVLYTLYFQHNSHITHF